MLILSRRVGETIMVGDDVNCYRTWYQRKSDQDWYRRAQGYCGASQRGLRAYPG